MKKSHCTGLEGREGGETIGDWKKGVYQQSRAKTSMGRGRKSKKRGVSLTGESVAGRTGIKQAAIQVEEKRIGGAKRGQSRRSGKKGTPSFHNKIRI